MGARTVLDMLIGAAVAGALSLVFVAITAECKRRNKKPRAKWTYKATIMLALTAIGLPVIAYALNRHATLQFDVRVMAGGFSYLVALVSILFIYQMLENRRTY